MKILHVINNLGSGGAEKLIEESVPLINTYPKIEAEVLLLTSYNSVFLENLKSKGVRVEALNLGSIYNPLNIFKIKEKIEKNKYDIVHAHLFPTQYWVAISKMLIKSKKIKFITTEHNTSNRRRGKVYFLLIDRYVYSQYDCIISISNSTQDNLINWINPPQEEITKYKVIENGINLDRFINAIPYQKREIKQEFSEKTKLLCMVGSFTEQKDQQTLIKAMEKLPNSVHLLLLGEGPLQEEKKMLVSKMGLEKRIHFLGFRNDVERILKTVDIVILSSNWEGFGLAALEGMAAGKPVIGSNVSGLRDVIGDQDLLFEVGNEFDLANKIINLLNNKEMYFQKAKQMQRRSENYDIKNMVDKYVEQYFELYNLIN